MKVFFLLLFIFSFFVVPTFSINTEIPTEVQETVFENLIISNQVFDFYQLDNIIFRGNTLKNVSITVNTATNVTIIDNSFEDPADITIMIWYADNLVIANNTFNDVPETAMHIIGTERSLIQGNKVTLAKENNNQFALLVGINIDRSPYTSLIGNDVVSPIGGGVFVNFSPNSYVFQNNIHHSGFGGLSVSSSEDLKVINNTITDSADYKKTHSGNIPPSSAVGISNSPRLEFIGNLIDYSDNTGVEVIMSEKSIIMNNTIINNKISGVFLGISPNSIVMDNIFYNNGMDIETEQSEGSTIQNNIVRSDSPIAETVFRPNNSDIEESPFKFYFISILAIVIIRKFKY